jgi:hypothetical protein
MSKEEDFSLISHLMIIDDPRIDRTKKHELIDILVIAICASICGAETWTEIEAQIAMTGHKDLKLADNYSKCTEDDQKSFSEMIMKHIRLELNKGDPKADFENVIQLRHTKSG